MIRRIPVAMTAFIVILCLPLLACQEEEEEEETEYLTTLSEPFATSTDLSAPSDVSTVSEYLAPEQLATESNIYNNAPSLVLAAEDPDACVEERMGALKFSVDGDTLSTGGVIDMADCVDGTDGISVSSFSISVYLALTCAGGDFSDYDGQSLFASTDDEDDFFAEEPCDGLTSSLILNMEMAIEMSDGESTLTSNSFDFLGTDSLGACTETLSGTTFTLANDCVSVSSSSSSFDGQTTSNFARLAYTGITGEGDGSATWFSAGTIAFVLNNWTGTLTFTGSETAPTYEMTDGTSTLSGSLTASSASARPYRAGDSQVDTARDYIARTPFGR